MTIRKSTGLCFLLLLCISIPPAAASGAGATPRELLSVLPVPNQVPTLAPFDPLLPPANLTPSSLSPDQWCPSSRDFSSWIESRRIIQPRRTLAEGFKQIDRPTITFQDGYILLEDNGYVLRNDNVFDLPAQTLEFIPSGQGYSVSALSLAYEPNIGTPLFANATTWQSAVAGLRDFSFPFGGKDRTFFWITSALSLAFEEPSPSTAERFCTVGCYHRKVDALLDPIPRIAPLEHGADLYGWNAYFREATDRAVITWRANGGGVDLDVQVVLFPNGRIHLNYKTVQGVAHGVAAVMSGGDAWLDDLRTVGQANDPEGDVTIAGPDGPSFDFLSARVDQVSGSEVLQVDLMIAQFLPAAPEHDMIFYVMLKDEPEDAEPFRTLFFIWSQGGWRYRGYNVSSFGYLLRFYLDRSEFLIADDDFTLELLSYRNTPAFEPGDSMSVEVTAPLPAASLMLDLSEDLPVTVENGMAFEAFTLPELIPGAVYDALMDELDNPRFDGIAIWQNFDTDIIFFAGGYHAGGNPGADGIGRGSSSDPERPSLLHVNNIYRIGTETWLTTLLNHEFGHRWLLSIAIDEGGGPWYILNPDKGHPAGWVHTPAVAPVFFPGDFSCMGGSNWTDNGNGTYTSQAFASGLYVGYSWLDLYLMGLAGPSEVPDWFYLYGAVPSLPSAYWAPENVTVSATRVNADIAQVEAAEGVRFPAYPSSRSEFHVPNVLVVRPGVYNQDETDLARDLCGYWKPRFETATDGRGVMRCSFSPPEVQITFPANDPVVITAGTVVDFTGQGQDLDGDAVALTWDFSIVAPSTSGPGPHSITFDMTGTFLVTLSGVDATGMRATSSDTRTVTVTCGVAVPPDEVEPLWVAKESGLLRFEWIDVATGPQDYVVLDASIPQGPFAPRGAADAGVPGLLLPGPPETTFYKVAPRYDPGCLGPY